MLDLVIMVTCKSCYKEPPITQEGPISMTIRKSFQSNEGDVDDQPLLHKSPVLLNPQVLIIENVCWRPLIIMAADGGLETSKSRFELIVIPKIQAFPSTELSLITSKRSIVPSDFWISILQFLH